MEKWWIESQLRDQGRCVYCGFDLYSCFEAYLTTQADHLIPQRLLALVEHHESLLSHDAFRGESVHVNAIRNCVTACVFCNQMKGGWAPVEWEKMNREELIEAHRQQIAIRRIPHEAEFERRRNLLQARS
jgi:5-methylcytosine-specific restriction endonuclease McrA